MNTEQLILKVGKHPYLYDLGASDFKDVRKKASAWEEIGKIIGVEGTTLLFNIPASKNLFNILLSTLYLYI